MQVRLGEIRSDIEIGKGLTVNFYLDLAGLFDDVDLSDKRKSRDEQQSVSNHLTKYIRPYGTQNR